MAEQLYIGLIMAESSEAGGFLRNMAYSLQPNIVFGRADLHLLNL